MLLEGIPKTDSTLTHSFILPTKMFNISTIIPLELAAATRDTFYLINQLLTSGVVLATFCLEYYRRNDDVDNKPNANMFEIDVFRFMDGTSCYILDDDDEYVYIHSDNAVIRVREFTGIVHQLDGNYVEFGYVDMDGKDGVITVDEFYDNFEAEKFAEFIIQFIEKTDSDSGDDESVYDKDD